MLREVLSPLLDSPSALVSLSLTNKRINGYLMDNFIKCDHNIGYVILSEAERGNMKFVVWAAKDFDLRKYRYSGAKFTRNNYQHDFRYLQDSIFGYCLKYEDFEAFEALSRLKLKPDYLSY
jgi:hypothetical protein